jgi:hypothetical protein
VLSQWHCSSIDPGVLAASMVFSALHVAAVSLAEPLSTGIVDDGR